MKFTVKSNMKKKAERTVAISMSLYLELLEKDAPFFSLKLVYQGEKLVEHKLEY